MAYDRGGDAQRVGTMVDALLGGTMGRSLSAAQRAARAWYAANGDRERAHTTGVWLRKSGRVGVDPILVVAVDAPWLAQELGTNKDLYLSRLSFSGLKISDIRFMVSRETSAAARKAQIRKDATRAEKSPLAPLTSSEQERIERATEGLPQGLKESMQRAMSASLRRSKSSNGI